ncbi:MAG: oxaloacetate decarboxylase (Na+ extruding) subunit gamma [Pseudomonadota bacterium]|jgi:oxaloacetate decarboxylase gamma subunit|nr:oxaloacetate decarboxylase (Na+ extruding) subunit gamma [Pseudomonadota bacterium]
MTELMSSGLELMLAGMVIVFLFLAMLVVVINTTSKLIARYLPEDTVLHHTHSTVTKVEASKSDIAAITAAVHQYRNTH